MTPGDLSGILKGEVPTPTKEELRLAAKRQSDRKRYALKTNINWKQDDKKDAPAPPDRSTLGT